MRKALVAALLLAAAPALANPMLDKCLPVAPPSCGLTDKSAAPDFLSCFESVPLSPKKAAEAACAEELSHARVHAACDAADIPKVCAGVKPGADRVMSCLRKHQKGLGAECRKALKTYDDGAGGVRKKSRHGGVAAVRC